MIKRIAAIFICVFMLAARGGVFYDCEPECESSPKTEKDLLREDISLINGKILAYTQFSELTGDQLKILLEHYYKFQEKYSGKPIREVDGKKYYYPRFVKEFVWADDLDMKDLAKVIDKKNARFSIVTLDKNDDGIFKGIEILGWTKFE